jgi:hypothetical protein
MRYIHGHHLRGNKQKRIIPKGELNHRWRGGKTLGCSGYVRIMNISHPRADKYGYVGEHILVVENHIGRMLDRQNVVHHINGIKYDNHIENLQIFATRSEHTQHHTRMKAEAECGNPEWRKCFGCKEYDNPNNMIFHGGSFIHKTCNSSRRKKQHTNNKFMEE